MRGIIVSIHKFVIPRKRSDRRIQTNSVALQVVFLDTSGYALSMTILIVITRIAKRFVAIQKVAQDKSIIKRIEL